jgi:hypothetical protein
MCVCVCVCVICLKYVEFLYTFGGNILQTVCISIMNE